MIIQTDPPIYEAWLFTRCHDTDPPRKDMIADNLSLTAAQTIYQPSPTPAAAFVGQNEPKMLDRILVLWPRVEKGSGAHALYFCQTDPVGKPTGSTMWRAYDGHWDPLSVRDIDNFFLDYWMDPDR